MMLKSSITVTPPATPCELPSMRRNAMKVSSADWTAPVRQPERFAVRSSASGSATSNCCELQANFRAGNLELARRRRSHISWRARRCARRGRSVPPEKSMLSSGARSGLSPLPSSRPSRGTSRMKWLRRLPNRRQRRCRATEFDVVEDRDLGQVVDGPAGAVEERRAVFIALDDATAVREARLRQIVRDAAMQIAGSARCA